MKTLCALLLGIGFLFSAGSAIATPAPIDPSVIINRTPHDAITFSTNSITNPLVIDLVNGFSPAISFEYTGTNPLTKLFVQLDGAFPLETFFCQSDIFTGDCGSFNTGSSTEDGLIFQRKKGTNEEITTDEEFSVAVAAPEPGTLLLVLSGLALFPFLRKR